jgi:tRNA dimethylallyltransferase
VSFSILAVLGPTASGKSALGINIAHSLASAEVTAEIVNADAMQLYSEMNIGTAKLPESEREGIPHHLFDVIKPDQEMTAVQFQSIARGKIQQLLAEGKLPILVGGSMFYVSSVLDNLDFAPTDQAIRERLESESEGIGALAMHERLAGLDPATAQRIPAQNIRRVIRALEVIELTGERYSSVLPEPKFWLPTLQLGIEVDRVLLKDRIAKRVRAMWADGLVEETAGLISNYRLSKTAQMAIGYKQAIALIEGQLTKEEAIAETIALTNRYARRQMSWFRRDKRTKWLDSDEDLLGAALKQIRLEQ